MFFPRCPNKGQIRSGFSAGNGLLRSLYLFFRREKKGEGESQRERAAKRGP